MSLTDTVIKKTKPKAFTLKDSKGLSLYVSPTGTKSWHFRYTFNGKEKRISLSTYPYLSLKDARILCEKYKQEIHLGFESSKQTGKNGQAECCSSASNQQQEPSITFGEFALHWKAFKFQKLCNKADKRQSTAIQIDHYLTKDLLPGLGHLP
ncbi:protein of unknown function (DUF4102) [Apibacter mensalis]|uniref:Integrase DNA-binding domain-containing protein n=1 Tax=Apibacter mensalis TaxID=1586267 RepID=A0A0X3ANQ9_9FLAO|nr:Arm DNA-binding domain-containing protein [Apibacter mensalis]CVK15994.1 protein of unknown function (DUF4102) [Apibacter mensalis]